MIKHGFYVVGILKYYKTRIRSNYKNLALFVKVGEYTNYNNALCNYIVQFEAPDSIYYQTLDFVKKNLGKNIRARVRSKVRYEKDGTGLVKRSYYYLHEFSDLFALDDNPKIDTQ